MWMEHHGFYVMTMNIHCAIFLVFKFNENIRREWGQNSLIVFKLTTLKIRKIDSLKFGETSKHDSQVS